MTEAQRARVRHLNVLVQNIRCRVRALRALCRGGGAQIRHGEVILRRRLLPSPVVLVEVDKGVV